MFKKENINAVASGIGFFRDAQLRAEISRVTYQIFCHYRQTVPDNFWDHLYQ